MKRRTAARLMAVLFAGLTLFRPVSANAAETEEKKPIVMYSARFGSLPVYETASEDSGILSRVAYREPVRVLEDNGDPYLKVRFCHPITGQIIEGWCRRDALTRRRIDDVRIYLPVFDWKQTDSRWKDTPLGDGRETIESAGCTTVCLAMSTSYLENQTVTPDQMKERLFYNDDGTLGMPSTYLKYDKKDYLQQVYRALAEKKPVLAGGFRESGYPHWVLVYAYTGSDPQNLDPDEFLIHDPYTDERQTLGDFYSVFTTFNKIAYYCIDRWD